MSIDTNSSDLINVTFKDEAGADCHLVVHSPAGGGGSYHVTVNNYNRGCVVPCSVSGWRPYVNGLSQRIVDRIVEVIRERNTAD